MKLIIFFFLFIISVSIIAAIPSITPYINDNSYMLTTSEISSLNNLAKELDEKTGVEIAVLLVNGTENYPIEEYANQVFEKNNIGKKGIDNGILIIINTDDNNWIIQVGYGLEGAFNDAKIANIGRTYLEPAIDEGDYSGGIYQTIYQMSPIIYDSGATYRQSFFDKYKYYILAIILLILIMIVTKGQFFIWLMPLFEGLKGFGGGRSGGGGGKR